MRRTASQLISHKSYYIKRYKITKPPTQSHFLLVNFDRWLKNLCVYFLSCFKDFALMKINGHKNRRPTKQKMQKIVEASNLNEQKIKIWKNWLTNLLEMKKTTAKKLYFKRLFYFSCVFLLLWKTREKLCYCLTFLALGILIFT